MLYCPGILLAFASHEPRWIRLTILGDFVKIDRFIFFWSWPPHILSTFAPPYFIIVCPAALGSNLVCGRMLKKYGGANAEKICQGQLLKKYALCPVAWRPEATAAQLEFILKNQTCP